MSDPASGPAETLRIVSHFPGRLRVRAKAFRDPARADQLVDQLRGEAGVTAATAAPLTGSVLVEYDAGAVQLPWLVQLIVQLGGLAGIATDHHGGGPRFTGPSIRGAVERWNATMVGATRGRLDARVVLPSTLASLGVLRFMFNRRLPEWYDLLFWSFVTFQNLNPPPVTLADEPHADPEGDGEPA